MAAFDLEEQEQISRIKAWWDQYGKYVTAAIVAAALAVVSWQGWQWYQGKQAAEASALFATVQQAADANEPAKAREAAGQLIERYSGTAYAPMGALLSAALLVEADDARNARAQLDWVVKNANEAAVKDLARVRIAVILLDEGNHDEALSMLSNAPHASMKARFAELRGDIQVAAGRNAEARAAYNEALAALAEVPAQTAERLRTIVSVKLEAVES